MPGTILPPNPVDTLPFSLSTKFSEQRGLDINSNMYADGSCDRNPLMASGRRKWSISKRLSIANLQTLGDFWLAHRAAPFYFYNPHETDPPFSHSPSGDAGRYVVRFNSDWQETIGMPRSDASIELMEIATWDEVGAAANSNPYVLTPVAYMLSITSSWTADFDGRSTANVNPFTAGLPTFGRLPILSSNSSYSKRTDVISLKSLVDIGWLPLTTEYGIRGLTLNFFSDIYPQTTSNAGQQMAEFRVYDVSLAVTYPDGTVRTFVPSTAFLQSNGGTATLTDGPNAVDGDPNTYATLTALPIGGLLWTLASPSPLVITGFH